MNEPSCHKCNGFLEPDNTCANYYCPNFTFKPPMKQETDTPETDKFSKTAYDTDMDDYAAYLKMQKYAEKLERERDQARKIAESMRHSLSSYRHFKENPFPWETTKPQ